MFNKEIKLGKYTVLFNRIRNVYFIKEYNHIMVRSKEVKNIIKELETLHNKELISIIEYHLFREFIDNIEKNRIKPMTQRHVKQLRF